MVLLVLPIPLSYLNLAVPRSSYTIGFSGLNMALFGFLLVELAAYLERYFTDQFSVKDAPAFFFLVTAFIAAPHVESILAVVVLVVSLLMAVVYSMGLLVTDSLSPAAIKENIDRQGYFELLLVGGLVAVAFVPISFPLTPVSEAGIINLYGHLTGFSIGFIAVYVWIFISTSYGLL
jgi:hypothetical protein